MYNYRLAVLLMGSVYALESLHADDGQYPNVGMDYDATFQYDHVHSDSPQGGNRNSTDAYPDINATFYFRFNHDKQIQFSTEINPIDGPEPGQKRFFEDVGLVINDLNYYQNNANSAFMLGKYHEPFGRARRALQFAPDFGQRACGTGHQHSVDHELHQFARRQGAVAHIARAYPQHTDHAAEHQKDHDHRHHGAG